MGESQPSVLVVADATGESDALQAILSGRGWEASLSGDPLDALARIERAGFDLVIVDLKSPEMDGLELLAKIRYVAPRIPVILTTGSRSWPRDLDVAQSGATAVLRKPIVDATLFTTVDRVLKATREDREPADTLHDSSLTNALAGIIERLRTRRYEGLKAFLQDLLRGETLEFTGDLAQHLKYEEEILFPALAELKPEARPRLGEVEEEHERLREFSRRLAHRLREGDASGAVAVAREFLAALLEHIDRESALVNEVVTPLGYRASIDLGRRLLLRRLRVSLRGRP